MFEEQDEASNVSPEEQAQYDEFVKNGLALLHNDQSRSSLMQRLQEEDDPANALAETTVMITRRLVESARENQINLSSDVILHGGIEILEAIVETAESLNIAQFSEEVMERATLLAMDLYRTIETDAGELNQQEFQEDIQELQHASNNGDLDGLLSHIPREGEPNTDPPRGLGI